MAAFQIEGKIHHVFDVQSFDSGFTKREFVVETLDGQYPQRIKFELVRERTPLADGLNPGDSVMVHFDIRGNEYQGKYFVNLNCWRLDRIGVGVPAAPGYPAQPYPQQQPPYGGAQQPYGQPQAAPRQQQAPPPQQPRGNGQPYPVEAPGGFEDSEEDIPF